MAVALRLQAEVGNEVLEVQDPVGLQPPVEERKRHRGLVQEPEDAMARLAPVPSRV